MRRNWIGLLRVACLGGATACGVLFIGVLTLVLQRGSHAAVLLLDHQAVGAGSFPYPLTIQNLLWLLFAVGVGDVVHRRACAWWEARMVRASILPTDGDTVLVPESLREVLEHNETAARFGRAFVNDLVDRCVQHFQVNRSGEEARQVLGSLVDLQLHRTDLRYSLLRYLAWVIPTVGFIGTVVGLSGALVALQGQLGDDGFDAMGPVVESLGLAFDTTIVALCLSAVLVALMQAARKREELAVNASAEHCLRNLVGRLYVPASREG